MVLGCFHRPSYLRVSTGYSRTSQSLAVQQPGLGASPLPTVSRGSWRRLPVRAADGEGAQTRCQPPRRAPRSSTRTSALPEGSRRSQAASKQTPAALSSPKPGPPRGPKPGGQPRRCPSPPGSVEPVPGPAPGPCRPLSPRRPGAESRPVPCRRCRGREGRKGVGGKRQRRRCRGSSPPAPTWGAGLRPPPPPPPPPAPPRHGGRRWGWSWRSSPEKWCRRGEICPKRPGSCFLEMVFFQLLAELIDFATKSLWSQRQNPCVQLFSFCKHCVVKIKLKVLLHLIVTGLHNRLFLKRALEVSSPHQAAPCPAHLKNRHFH